MAIHKTEIIWHDLIEDPNDLPEKSGYTSICASVLEMNLVTGEIEPSYEGDLWWNQEDKMWESTWDEYGDYGGTSYVRSYGIEPVYHPDSDRRDEAYSDDYAVVAWCEGPGVYTPNIENVKLKEKE